MSLIRLLSLLIFTFAPLSYTNAQSLFDCDLLVGTWFGEHTYENGQYSRWQAVYSADGVFDIEFFGRESDEVLSSQLGSWECDGLWVTSKAVEQGQEYVFSYQIKALDSLRYQYESTQGVLFTSYRRRGG